jgi:hypothetical protein
MIGPHRRVRFIHILSHLKNTSGIFRITNMIIFQIGRT